MYSEFKKHISQASKIAIFGHKHPDGDAIGSMLAMGTILEKLGKTVSYFTPTIPSKLFNFLPKLSKISADFDYGQYDFLLFLDFNALDRLGKFYENNPEYFDNNKILTIDHHQGNPDFSVFYIQDQDAVSCCEIIFEVLDEIYQEYIDTSVATYLLLGQITDSGNFMYEKDHKRTFKNTYKMLEYGADKDLIIQNTFYNKSFGSLQIIQKVLSRMKQKGNILWSWVNNEDLQKYGVEREEAKQGLAMMTTVGGFDVYILINIEDDGYKIHFRSIGDIYDVSNLAKKLGGGGHFNASGASIDSGNLESVIKSITDNM